MFIVVTSFLSCLVFLVNTQHPPSHLSKVIDVVLLFRLTVYAVRQSCPIVKGGSQVNQLLANRRCEKLQR